MEAKEIAQSMKNEKRPDNKRCSKCHGAGMIDYIDASMTCDRCYGTGHNDTHKEMDDILARFRSIA